MLIAKPRRAITDDELIKLLFGKDTAQIRRDYGSTGWFLELMDKMKGEFEVKKISKKLYHVPTSGINFEFETDEFHDYYEVREE